MSDTKTFTVSGTDTEIKDIVSMGANPLDKESNNDTLNVLLSKNPKDLNAEDIKILKLYKIRGNEKAEEKLDELNEEPDEKSEPDEKTIEVEKVEEEYESEDEEEPEEEPEEEDEPEPEVDINALKNEFPLNVWYLIDTYFRDNPYFKSKHQLDSYNELIYSETNGIRYIIKRENPLSIYKGLDEKTNTFDHKIYIYFGETFDDNKELKEDVENIFITSPTIYDSGKSSYMYPNDARLKSLTYAMNIFCNIGIKIEDISNNKTYYITHSFL